MNKTATKKVKIDKSNALVFFMVTVASLFVVSAFVLGRNLVDQTNYYKRVNSKKEAAKEVLVASKKEVDKLRGAYETFNIQEPNLLGGNLEGDSDHDGSNSSIVLSSLPSTYDFPALIASIEKLLVGYQVSGISGSDDIITQASASGDQPVEIPFSFSVNTDYMSSAKLLSAFDNSIRPFAITKLDISGGDTLNINVSAKTYFQPAVGLKIDSEVVK